MNAAAITAELVQLGRDERELIHAGRLEDLAPLAVRRGELTARLQECLPGALERGGELPDLLGTLRHEGAESLALLQSIRADLARELNGTSTTSRAVHAYGGSSRL